MGGREGGREVLVATVDVVGLQLRFGMDEEMVTVLEGHWSPKIVDCQMHYGWEVVHPLPPTHYCPPLCPNLVTRDCARSRSLLARTHERGPSCLNPTRVRTDRKQRRCRWLCSSRPRLERAAKAKVCDACWRRLHRSRACMRDLPPLAAFV